MTRLTFNTHRSIGFQAVALAGSTGTAQIIMAVIYIVTARSSAPSEFGLVVAAIALGTTAVGLFDFGTNSYWTRELASGRLDKTVLGQRLAAKLFYAALGLGIWSVSTFGWLPATSLWMAGPVAMCVLVNQSFQVPLRSIGRGDLLAVAVLFEKTVAAAVFVFMLAIATPPISALWWSLCSGALACAILCWRLTPYVNRPPLVLHRATNPWKSSRHYGMATVALTAQSLDIPALTMFGGASAAGIYAAVSRWTQPMTLLASAFSSASAPHIAKAQTAREAWQYARKSVWLLGVAIVLSILTAIFSPTIVDILIGANYAGAGDVLRVLAIATVFAIINQPLYIFLQSRGFDKPISLITLCTVIFQLVLVTSLAGILHELGAAFAFLSTQLTLLLAMGILLATKWGEMRDEVAPAKALKVSD